MKTGNVLIGATSSIVTLTLDKYLNQKNPSKNIKVKLNKSQVDIGKYDNSGVRSVFIKKLTQYEYLQIKGKHFLYTQDRSGNPDRPTIFLLESKP